MNGVTAGALVLGYTAPLGTTLDLGCPLLPPPVRTIRWVESGAELNTRTDVESITVSNSPLSISTSLSNKSQLQINRTYTANDITAVKTGHLIFVSISSYKLNNNYSSVLSTFINFYNNILRPISTIN